MLKVVLQGIWRYFLVKIVDENSGLPFLTLYCSKIFIWLEYRKEEASKQVVLWWCGAIHGAWGRAWLHSLGLHQRALGWNWEPKSRDVSPARGLTQPWKERRAADLLTMWSLGEICRFCENHKTLKRSSERLRNFRQQSQPFSVALKLYMEIFADEFYLSENRSW